MYVCAYACIIFNTEYKAMMDLNCWERFALKVLKNGHIPQHIAFIMDGNRRFAKNIGKAATSGHSEGAKILKKCLLYCLELGVKVASFYAFALDNFNRNPDEVDFLMSLAMTQFQQLSKMDRENTISDLVQKNDIKVVFAGDLDGKLAESYPLLRENFKKLQQKTKQNTRMTVYICFAYDSLFQITQAANKIPQPLRTPSTVFKQLMIPHQIDILIRTSNQSRLSNFMLMQCQYAQIEIEKTYWPSFNLFSMAKILLRYHYNFKQIQKVKAMLKM